MLLNYKYEIFPTNEQQELLNRWIGICRQQYNSALIDKENYYKKYKKNLKRTELQSIQTKDKKKLTFLKELPSQPLQEVFVRLEKAFKKFFRKEAKYPKLKKHKDYTSLTFTQFGIGKQYQTYKGKKVLRTVRRTASFGKGGKLQISSLGLIELKRHRKIDGKIKQCIIKRQGNKWFAIFSVERHVNPIEQVDISNPVGIDVGIKHYATLSNGKMFENHKYLRQTEKKLKREQRKLSQKQKNSKNYQKQLIIVQKLHNRVANQRKDYLHKLSTKLSKSYSLVCVENLNIRNMVRNRKLAKSIYDAGWGMFRNMLEYKCEKYRSTFMKVEPKYTTTDCSCCGNRIKKSLSVRTHICSKCGTILDRDHNAAINILNKGLAQLNVPVLA